MESGRRIDGSISRLREVSVESAEEAKRGLGGYTCISARLLASDTNAVLWGLLSAKVRRWGGNMTTDKASSIVAVT
jgi:hypothetical protein